METTICLFKVDILQKFMMFELPACNKKTSWEEQSLLKQSILGCRNPQ